MTLIDVRSPAEYEESTIPGSLNIPLFDDGERAEIGTIYNRIGSQAAKERGLEIVSAKLPRFIRSFSQIEGNKTVFCWRGGMRSKTTATVLSLMDIHVSRLNGGYRAYRKWVVDTLESCVFPPAAYIIHGNTGTGKTLVLRALKERGHPVLDLEGMAGHRGSIFGEIGLKGNNQKTFDALLLEEVLGYMREPYVMLEAESKRIGKVIVPEFLMRKREDSVHIFLEMPIASRVRHILNDYHPWEHAEECLNAYRRIQSRIHTPIAAEIETSLKQGEFARAVELLLVYYYDPRYAYTTGQYGMEPGQMRSIRATTVEEAVAAVESMVPSREMSSSVKAGR